MRFLSILLSSLLLSAVTFAQVATQTIQFKVKPSDLPRQVFEVEMSLQSSGVTQIPLQMPAWTSGYYQFMHFADQVNDFHVYNEKNDTLKWERQMPNGWMVFPQGKGPVKITYTVKPTKPFVAANWLDDHRAYVSPAGMFLYIKNKLQLPVNIEVIPRTSWQMVATGMEQLAKPGFHFKASDFDLLYDSPILMGELEALPAFKVDNKEHRFIAYKPGNFDKTGFMNDMKKIIETASGIIGDIPYPHYTFLAMGPGGGGIEHLNSASIAFEGSRLNERQNKIRTYNFLAHEYFHHYNVKRIRPIELGPFDYENGSRTKMLWLSEGITVYYEYLILRRAGMTTDDELLETLSSSITEYETKPGRQFQTPAEASFNTWEEGPFGRTGDKVNKTISPYDKGPLLGIMLDLTIRHETRNKRSMDDLMRRLYFHYYKKLNRGFTEEEFRQEAEKIAGRPLDDFFDQIYTLKPADHNRFLGYAGLQLEKTEGPKGPSYKIVRKKSSSSSEQELLNSWLNGYQ